MVGRTKLRCHTLHLHIQADAGKNQSDTFCMGAATAHSKSTIQRRTPAKLVLPACTLLRLSPLHLVNFLFIPCIYVGRRRQESIFSAGLQHVPEEQAIISTQKDAHQPVLSAGHMLTISCTVLSADTLLGDLSGTQQHAPPSSGSRQDFHQPVQSSTLQGGMQKASGKNQPPSSSGWSKEKMLEMTLSG